MIWVDYVIVAIIAVSALISLVRGFVREALSLTALVLAVWVGLTYSGALALLLEPHVETPSLRMGVSFAALFVVTLILGGLLGSLMVKLVESSGLTGTDRLLGMIFGMGRGVVLVGLLVLLSGLTAFPADPWWQQSRLIPHFQNVAVQIRALLPPEVADVFVYD
jgi:membrane protein required for colicin V production